MVIYSEFSQLENGDFPVRYVKLPEGMACFMTLGYYNG
jgi:hypothetical protein